MAEVYGSAAPGFEPVRALMSRAIDDGDETGLSLCAVRDGQVLADLWGGIADAETGAPWREDTVVNTFSVTKTMTALAALLLIDAGELDPDAPVARYWPEFAAAGKQGVLVRHVLGHTSGVAGWQQPVTVADIADTDKATALLAAQRPWWTPGEGSGYHALNYGHLVGELVYRLTGRSLGAFFAAELAAPLGADFFIGTPAAVDHRIARLVPDPAASGTDFAALGPDSLIRKALLNPAFGMDEVAGSRWRRAELGAMNGHGNARSVARVQSLVSHGGLLDAGPSLRPATLDRIFDVQADGTDRVLSTPLRFGLGYAVSPLPGLPPGRLCWWCGYGGAIVLNDLDRRLTVAYVMNKMSPGLIGLSRAATYLAAVYAGITD
jgi:CubicO group peptidase (beta-lactamase class C family)